MSEQSSATGPPASSADADNAATTQPAAGDDSQTPPRYFCHQCQRQVDINEQEFTCMTCGGGFLEVIEPGEEEENEDLAHMLEGGAAAAGGHGPGMFFGGLGGGGGAAGDNVDFQQFAQLLGQVFGGPPPAAGAGGAGAGPGGARPAGGAQPQPLQQFLQTLMTNLATDAGGGLQFQLHGDEGGTFQFMMPGTQTIHGDPRDYAWGAGGLDQIVTQLLNQFEGGQPPMDQAAIDRLPTIEVTDTLIEKSSQCTTCFDDFTKGEKVRQLPCRHIFHNDCIVPWLERHGTCPICRQNVANPGQPPQQPMDTTTATSGQSATGQSATATQSSTANSTSQSQSADDGRTVMEEIDELD